MKTTISSSTGIAVAIGLSGCAADPPRANPPTPDPSSVAATHAAIHTDLDRLRALDVFTVGGVVRDLPSEATSCYRDDIGGLPCPGWEDAVHAADAANEPRLATLVGTAEGAAASAVDPAYAMDTQRVGDDLAALRALQIVEIGELVVTVPDNSANCYGIPCPGEQARADAENRARAAKLDAITLALRK
jgi:hypothetical protein